MTKSKAGYRLFILFICLIDYSSMALSMPKEYVEDKETVALWHFDKYKDIFLDAKNHHKLKIYRNNKILKVDSLPGFDQSVNGFAKNKLLHGLLDKAYPVHTFEAWVMWHEAADLPQNTSLHRQVVMVHPMSLTFSTLLYFQKDLLMLEIRSGNQAKQLRIISSKTSLRPKRWYHIAYTVAKGDFDGDQDSLDTLVKLYLNDQENTDLTPDPVVDRLFEDFAYKAKARHFRLGKFSVSGNDYFRGRIDEVRYSNVARTEFLTFVSNGESVASSAIPSPSKKRRRALQKLFGVSDEH